LCIKISKLFLRVALQELYKGNNLFLAPALGTFIERKVQHEAHWLRRKYRMTNTVSLKISYSMYAQVKTRVNGKALKFYLEQGYFENRKQYLFRKVYVYFLWKLYNVPLYFEDLHLENVMYDESLQKIEIVDSSAMERSSGRQERSCFPQIDCQGSHTVRGAILDALDSSAKNNVCYTRNFDIYLLNSVNIKMRIPYEFHTIRDLNNYKVEFYSARTLVSFWEKRDYPRNWFTKSTAKDQRNEQTQTTDDEIVYRRWKPGIC